MSHEDLFLILPLIKPWPLSRPILLKKVDARTCKFLVQSLVFESRPVLLQKLDLNWKANNCTEILCLGGAKTTGFGAEKIGRISFLIHAWIHELPMFGGCFKLILCQDPSGGASADISRQPGACAEEDSVPRGEGKRGISTNFLSHKKHSVL